jgi:hypothetical protein
MADSKMGSSSGGDAFQRSMGVIELNVLVTIGEPAREREFEVCFDDWIFCFCLRRAFANQVETRL